MTLGIHGARDYEQDTSSSTVLERFFVVVGPIWYLVTLV